MLQAGSRDREVDGFLTVYPGEQAVDQTAVDPVYDMDATDPGKIGLTVSIQQHTPVVA